MKKTKQINPLASIKNRYYKPHPIKTPRLTKKFSFKSKPTRTFTEVKKPFYKFHNQLQSLIKNRHFIQEFAIFNINSTYFSRITAIARSRLLKTKTINNHTKIRLSSLRKRNQHLKKIRTKKYLLKTKQVLWKKYLSLIKRTNIYRNNTRKNKNLFNGTKKEKLKVHRYKFFKTLIGQLLTTTHYKGWATGWWLNTWTLINIYNIQYLYKWRFIPHVKDVTSLKQLYTRGKIYNLIRNAVKQKKKKGLIFPPTQLFRSFWSQHKKEPWLSPLIFKRGLYSYRMEHRLRYNKYKLRKSINYVNNKNPNQTKKNKLYFYYQYFIYNKKKVIDRKKMSRIKQILEKIIYPFYGKTTTKQAVTFWKKNKKIKSSAITTEDRFFGHFERRLDVLIFRLNFAPDILWARRLIWAGTIFITKTSNFDTVQWTKMQQQLKKHAYPLKLRDPKNLYNNTYWEPLKFMTKYKFLSEPITNINYLVKVGEIIQYNPGANFNQFRNHYFLYHKIIPDYLFTIPNTHKEINSYLRNIQTKQINVREKQIIHSKTAILLTDPTCSELLPTDRIKENFLRWVSL